MEAPGVRKRRITVGLGGGEFFDVDAPSLPVDLGYFALVVLVVSAHDLYLVVLSDGQGSDAVLLPEVGSEGGCHQSITEVAGGLEVGFARLSTGA